MTEIDYGRFHEDLRRARTAAGGGAARWELLRRFQQEWGYEPAGGPRREPEEPDEHKEYVTGLREAAGEGTADGEPQDVDPALAIPAALKEWWELPFNSFADRSELYETNPVWPPTLRPDPTGYGVADGLPPGNPFAGPDEDQRVCVFMAENQYCNEWGYPAARSALADPPVLVSGLGDDGEPGWQLQSHSVSEFFLQLALTRLPAHFGWTVEEGDVDEEVVARLTEHLHPLGLLPWRELGARTEFFGGRDVIVAHNTGFGDFGFVAYGRSEQALLRLAGALGVDWSEWICEPESRHEER
ncbi:hypothetical protein [Streptomyces sp. NPDC029704]|uniref:hypothetical protein n=1 Tax=Streptomyces sp. NPDC029704 TaxID=3156920 RepID=UPI0033C45388